MEFYTPPAVTGSNLTCQIEISENDTGQKTMHVKLDTTVLNVFCDDGFYWTQSQHTGLVNLPPGLIKKIKIRCFCFLFSKCAMSLYDRPRMLKARTLVVQHHYRMFAYQCSLPLFLACSASCRCLVAAAASAAALSFWNSAATAWNKNQQASSQTEKQAERFADDQVLLSNHNKVKTFNLTTQYNV